MDLKIEEMNEESARKTQIGEDLRDEYGIHA
jgi:hypothetical protein